MAKGTDSDNSQAVSNYIQKLDDATRPVVEQLRQIILSSSPQIAEEIKWNAPSFYYTGEMKPFDAKEYKRHIIVMNLHKRILLVFPNGAKINDPDKILTGDYTDGRRLLHISGMDDVLQKEKALHNAIRDWLNKVEVN